MCNQGSPQKWSTPEKIAKELILMAMYCATCPTTLIQNPEKSKRGKFVKFNHKDESKDLKSDNFGEIRQYVLYCIYHRTHVLCQDDCSECFLDIY